MGWRQALLGGLKAAVKWYFTEQTRPEIVAPVAPVIPFPVPVTPQPVLAPAVKQDVLSEAEMERLAKDLYYEELRRMPDATETYEAVKLLEQGRVDDLRKSLRARK